MIADPPVPEYAASSVGEEEHFEVRHIVMAISDWQVWVHILLIWSVVAPCKPRGSFPVSVRADKLVQFTGFPSSCPRSSGDLDIRLPSRTFSPFPRMPSPVSSSGKLPGGQADGYSVPAIVLLVFAYYSDKLKLRWPFILAGFLSTAVGFAINITDAPNGVKYFGTFLCIAGSYSSAPGVIAW